MKIYSNLIRIEVILCTLGHLGAKKIPFTILKSLFKGGLGVLGDLTRGHFDRT